MNISYLAKAGLEVGKELLVWNLVLFSVVLLPLSPPFPSIPCVSIPCPGSPSSRSSLRVLGALCSSPSGSGRSQADKRFLVHPRLKITVP